MRTIVREINRGESIIRLGGISEERVALFNRFKDYVVRGSYFSYSKHDILFSHLFDNDIVLASKLDVSDMAVRKLRSTLSQELYKAVGTDVVDKILWGSESELRDVTKTLDLAEIELSVSDMFPAELLKFVRDQSAGDENTYEIGDFDRELGFFKKFLMKSMKTEALDCDMSKLGFILRSLSTGTWDSQTNKYIVDRLLFK